MIAQIFSLAIAVTLTALALYVFCSITYFLYRRMYGDGQDTE